MKASSLRNHRVEYKPIEPARGAEIVALHEKLQMSQDVFVQAIQAKPATLKNREQNRSKPNHQITVLIRILSRHPDAHTRAGIDRKFRVSALAITLPQVVMLESYTALALKAVRMLNQGHSP